MKNDDILARYSSLFINQLEDFQIYSEYQPLGSKQNVNRDIRFFPAFFFLVNTTQNGY